MLPLLWLARHRLPPLRQIAWVTLLIGPPFALLFNLGFQRAPLSHAVVIGRSCRNVREVDALDHVLGYTAANDVSARDWQKEWGGGQFCRGKGFDTFCPLGPRLVTPDEIPDPGKLAIRGTLNGDLMQDSSTADLIFSVPQLIAFLSGSSTLPAGTVILTGTPSGVGAARKPPRFLQPGDTYTVEIEGIGRLENPVETEDA